MTTDDSRSNTTINIRIPKAKKALIDRAAEALGKKRTEFVLDALCEKAHEVLADRIHHQLSEKQVMEFNRLLDQPLSAAAIRMLTTPTPWGN